MIDNQEHSKVTPHDYSFYVVAVGASAGGLEALEAFFSHLSPSSGACYVVIQHLSPDFKSLMSEILMRYTLLNIKQVEHDLVLEPNTIYLNSAHKNVVLKDGRFSMIERESHGKINLPINQFFHSLAEDAANKAVAIILSGSGSDGSVGVQSISKHGGLIMAQTLETAMFDSMPSATKNSGLEPLMLAPEQMPAILEEYFLDPKAFREQLQADHNLSFDDEFRKLNKALYKFYDIDFSLYKPNTIRRRIERRIKLLNFKKLSQYNELLSQDKEEMASLYRDLLIEVTEFMRDIEAFLIIEKHVVPTLFADTRNEVIRIWVPGCATGEEAYSLAILCLEHVRKNNLDKKVKIFATDVHADSLELASLGCYAEDKLKNVSHDLRKKYFTRVGNKFKINNDVRRTVVVARHNLIKDAPFTRMDLISCRNLLIYLLPTVQQKIIASFYMGLNPQGLLFLGSSETLGDLENEFSCINRQWRLYQKSSDLHINLPKLAKPAAFNAMNNLQVCLPKQFRGSNEIESDLIQCCFELLEDMCGASVLVNHLRETCYIFGDINRYFNLKSGRTSLDVIDMADGELRMALTSSIHNANKNRKTIVYNAVALQLDKKIEKVRVKVKPVLLAKHSQPYFFISISEGEEISVVDKTQEVDFDLGAATKNRLDELEDELNNTKSHLHSTIEELETSNEELQSTNEELLASNEELQSTNEELHSVNEELYTVNGEYQKKIEELGQANDDINNLLECSEIGVLFLDEALCIRLFTPKAAEMLHLLPQDEGRPLRHFSHPLLCDELFEDISLIDNKKRYIEKEIKAPNNQYYLIKVFSYQSGLNDTLGFILTFTDITIAKQNEDKVMANSLAQHTLLNQYEDIQKNMRVIRNRLRQLENNHIATDINTLLDDLQNKLEEMV